MSKQKRPHNEILVRCYRNGALHWRHPIDFGQLDFPDDMAVIDLVRNKISVLPGFKDDYGDLLPSDHLEIIRPPDEANPDRS